MTEEEWDRCTSLSMLMHLVSDQPGHDRHINLWIVACCRQVEHLVGSDEMVRAIDAGERYAEETIQRTTLQSWIRRTRRHRRGLGPDVATSTRQACEALSRALWHLASYPNSFNPNKLAHALVSEAREQGTKGRVEDLLPPMEQRLVNLLRDMMGNPFRARPAHNPAWLEANGGLAGRLANSIFQEKRFTEMPILADALEDAGCTEATILEHLRSPELHARGCWALDVILGRGTPP
jgi:hypothetical protein